MKILVVDTDYPKFLYDLYKENQGLKEAPYDTQMKVRADSLFGIANNYTNNLRDLGHSAWPVYANNEYMQKAWATEHGVDIDDDKKYLVALKQINKVFSKVSSLQLKSFLDSRSSWFYDILEAQIDYYQPDVLLNQAINAVNCHFMQKIKSKVGLLVGQHAATRLDGSKNWNVYDLIISSFPPTVDWFRERGVRAELHRLGFEPQILSSLRDEGKKYDVSFIGSLMRGVHKDRIDLLDKLCREIDSIKIWTPDIHQFSKNSPIRKAYVGEVWGRSMFQILHNSKITINHHGSIPPYANNMRLYEATGVGTLLITDWKKNITDMFEPDKEIVVYRTPEECAELVQYYLDHDKEREKIPKAGQERTIREHTYHQRMEELIEIVGRYL